MYVSLATSCSVNVHSIPNVRLNTFVIPLVADVISLTPVCGTTGVGCGGFRGFQRVVHYGSMNATNRSDQQLCEVVTPAALSFSTKIAPYWLPRVLYQSVFSQSVTTLQHTIFLTWPTSSAFPPCSLLLFDQEHSRLPAMQGSISRSSVKNRHCMKPSQLK